MSSALPGAPAPTVVEDVVLSGADLTWTRAGVSEKIGIDHVLFILERGQSDDTQFLISYFEEDLENRGRPYRLSVLEAAAVPAEVLQRCSLQELPEHLRHGAGREVHVIVSTKSGTGLALRLWEDVLQPLWKLVATHLGEQSAAAAAQTPGQEDGGLPYRLTITQTSETIRDFAKDLWASSASGGSRERTVVLLSGDGGVVDLLHGSDGGGQGAAAPPETLPVMAILPLGTGNALFHSSHKPLYSAAPGPPPPPLVHGLRTLFRGVPADLPVFRASFSPGSRIVKFTDKAQSQSQSQQGGGGGGGGGGGAGGQFLKEEVSVSHLNGAIVASYGFHASIVYESDTPEYRVHGSKRFGMVAQELLKESHPYAAQLAIRRPASRDLEPIPRQLHAYALTAMVSNMEQTFAISPDTKPLEKRLRLVHFAPLGGERTMDVMMKAYDGGKHVNLEWDDGEKVGYDEVDEVQVTTQEEDERWRVVCIDGTIVQLPKGGQMRVKLLDTPLLRVLANPQVIGR